MSAMKNSPILRYFTVAIVHGIMYVLGIVLFPLYFTLRKTKVLWWFLNDSEGDYVSNTYGDEGYRVSRSFYYDNATWFSKLYEAFIWLAIRNSHWNFRLQVLAPKTGGVYDVEVIHNDTTPSTSVLTFCNQTIHGKQYAKYYVDGYKYFRYSFNKPFLGVRLNLHSGWSTTRWILKLRFFNN